MKKIENTQKSALKKAEEKKQPYTITVREKSNGFEARVTIKIVGGGANPRLEAYSSISVDESVLKLLYKVKARLIEYKKLGLLNKDISNKIYRSILTSMSLLGIEDEIVLKEVSIIFQILTNEYIIESSNVDIQNEMTDVQKENTAIVDVPSVKEIKSFKMVAVEWFNYRRTLLIQTDDNPNPLSPNTLKGDSQVMRNRLIPFFKGMKNIALITDDDAKNCLKSINGYTHKESVYIVLKLILKYARKQEYIPASINLEKPVKPFKPGEETIVYIESERQPLWLDKFEEEDTDFSLLCETLLILGLRPEERMWIKMESIKRGYR